MLGLAGLRGPAVDVDEEPLDGQHHRVSGVEAALVHGHQELEAAQVGLARHLRHLRHLGQQPGDQGPVVGHPALLAPPLRVRVPGVTGHPQPPAVPGPGPAQARPGVAAESLAQARAPEAAQVSPQLCLVPAPGALAPEIPANTEQWSAHYVVKQQRHLT